MILACDPGLSGAFAFRLDRSNLRIHDMPTYMDDKRRKIDAMGVSYKLNAARILGAQTLVVEDVHGAPGQSAPAAFTFGYGVGLVVAFAMAEGFAIERVASQVWKRALKVPADKRASRARASELLPAFAHLWPLAKHDGRAEAAMLALYAERYLK